MSQAQAAPLDPLAEARALRPLIEAEADGSDETLTLTKPLLDGFARTRLFHLMVPAELGGLEADMDTTIDVFEELANADGSIGWTQMANAASTSYVAFLDKDRARELVEGRPESTTAGQFSPFAQVSEEAGGYRVTGNFQFGSGSPHASYVGGAGFVLGDDGAPRMDGDVPAYVCFFVPRDGIELRGNWDVLGLRGTGSFDYHVKEQHVDAGMTFNLFKSEVKSGGSMFHLGAVALAGPGHAGWGLGVAQRALDEVAKIADGGRARMGAPALRDQQVFQRDFGQHSMALHSVRLLVHDVYGAKVEKVASGSPLTKADQDEMMASVSYMTEVALDCALFAYRYAGSQGLRNPSLVQRCFRDMFTGGQHIYVDRRSLEAFAQPKVGAGS